MKSKDLGEGGIKHGEHEVASRRMEGGVKVRRTQMMKDMQGKLTGR